MDSGSTSASTKKGDAVAPTLEPTNVREATTQLVPPQRSGGVDLTPTTGTTEHTAKGEVLQICAMVTALRQAFKDPSVLCAATAFALYRDHPVWAVRLIAPASCPRGQCRPTPRMILRNVLTIHTESGSHILIDCEWREHFNVQLQTAQYREFYKTLSSVFVGSMSTLTRHLKHHGAQVEACFRAFGISIPPWRTTRSMIQSFEFHCERAISVCSFCQALLRRHSNSSGSSSNNNNSSSTAQHCVTSEGISGLTPKGRVHFALPPATPEETTPQAPLPSQAVVEDLDEDNEGDSSDDDDENLTAAATAAATANGDPEARLAQRTGRKCTSILSRLLAQQRAGDIFTEAARAYATADTRPCPIPPPPGVDVYAAGSEVAQPFPEDADSSTLANSLYGLPSSILLPSYQDPPLAWPLIHARLYQQQQLDRAPLAPLPIPTAGTNSRRQQQQQQPQAMTVSQQLCCSPVRSNESSEQCLGEPVPPPPPLQFEVGSSNGSSNGNQPPPCLTPDVAEPLATIPSNASSLSDTLMQPQELPGGEDGRLAASTRALDPHMDPWTPPLSAVGISSNGSAARAAKDDLPPIFWGYMGKTPIQGPTLPTDFLSTLSAHWAPTTSTTTTNATTMRYSQQQQEEDSLLFEKVSPASVAAAAAAATATGSQQPQASLLSQLLSSSSHLS